jgi:hypothetical protein
MEVWKGKLVSGNATVSTNFNLVIYPTIWMVKDKATGTSRTEINIFQYQTISVGTTSLVPYLIPTDNRQLDFLLTSLNSGTGTLEIRANGVSTTSGSERIVIYLSQLSLSLSGASTTSGSERIVIYLSQLGLSLMGASTTNGDAQISIFVPLPQLLLSDILATSDSNGNALFNLYPVGWKPSLQYEELYFTITRTKDLYFSV